MRYALNIGMLTSTKYGSPVSNVSLARIASALHVAGLNPQFFRVKRSNTEDTACIIVRDESPIAGPSLHERIHTMAAHLQQDCIAVVPLDIALGSRDWVYAHSVGQLVGPYTNDWGTYKREFFIEVPL